MTHYREPGMESPELIQQFETNEIVAWRSIYQSPQLDMAAQLGLGFWEDQGALLLWNRAAPVPILNRLIGLGVFAPADVTTIDSFLNRSRVERCPCLVQVTPTAQPANLAEQLVARGLRQIDRWQVQYGTIGDSTKIAVPPEYRVEQVTAASAPLWAEVMLSGWQFPPHAALGLLALAIGLVRQPEWRCYAVIHQPSGALVACGTMYVAANVAGFYFDTVLPAHRGHDLQIALLQTRLAEAHGLGCTHACVPSPIGGSAERNMRSVGLDQGYERLNYLMERAAR